MSAPDVDVVVVGGGPTGLALGLLLERFGLRAVVAERRDERSFHPKARGIRLRASELLRVWGFDAELRSHAMPDESHRFIYCETVVGREIARTQPPGRRIPRVASVPSYRVTQDIVEGVLESGLAGARGVELRRGVDVLDFEQLPDRVVVRLATSAGEESVSARYVVAADGGTSPMRSLLGIGLGSGKAKAYWHSVFWRGDLLSLVPDRPAIAFYTQAGGEALVAVGAAGLDGRWVTFVQLPPSSERPPGLSDDEAVAITRAAIGLPDFPLELISTATFRIGADVADSYRRGRVFLAGDAAHVLPPTGGFGINTGFADVHNLAWKLALVLGGHAPESLLDSYERERRPVALSNIAWSEGNRARLSAIREALRAGDGVALQALVDDQSDHVDPMVQDLAFGYGDEGDDVAVLTRATVGARAPHADTGGGTSIHDLFEGRLTMLVGSDAAREAASAVLEPFGSLGQVLDLREIPDPEGDVSARYVADAILVRPDGHVGWIAAAGSDERAMRDAVERVVDHGPSGPDVPPRESTEK